jgi:hypothetical protein
MVLIRIGYDSDCCSLLLKLNVCLGIIIEDKCSENNSLLSYCSPDTLLHHYTLNTSGSSLSARELMTLALPGTPREIWHGGPSQIESGDFVFLNKT